MLINDAIPKSYELAVTRISALRKKGFEQLHQGHVGYPDGVGAGRRPCGQVRPRALRGRAPNNERRRAPAGAADVGIVAVPIPPRHIVCHHREIFPHRVFSKAGVGCDRAVARARRPAAVGGVDHYAADPRVGVPEVFAATEVNRPSAGDDVVPAVLMPNRRAFRKR